MKKILFIAALFTALNAQALTVQNAEVKNGNLDLTLSYGGGCEKHEFDLKIGSCLETFPVQCPITISDVSPTIDMCEAIVTEVVSFSLEKEGLTDSYYERALLTISGGSQDKGASVHLPKLAATTPQGTVESILGYSYTNEGIEYQVQSGGCTNKDNFKIDVLESFPVQLVLRRVKFDSCEAYLPYGTKVLFKWSDLGLKSGESFRLSNPTAVLNVR